jgi:hypothetical protein
LKGSFLGQGFHVLEIALACAALFFVGFGHMTLLDDLAVRDALNVLVALDLSHTEMGIIAFGLELK